MIPFYIGWVFASRELFPPYILDILTSNNPSSASFDQFMLFGLGMFVMGPFLGGSTLLYNDYWDSEIDKTSKRKAAFPLPMGLVSSKSVLYTSIVLMILALFFSYFISLLFMMLVGLALALSICYSTPPIRLKNRAGLDVLTNAIGSGLLCSIAGWIVVKPFFEYPILWGFTSIFGVCSIYIPTTIIDQPNDKRKEVNTFAVRLGQKNAFYAGVFSIAMANILIVYMGLTNYLITMEFLIVAWPVALAQPIAYALILRKLTFKSVYRTIMALAGLLTVGNALMLTYYVGLWSIY
ncbi:MAG: UbiA prenyltransferase family protein [Thermoplasmata archaeon]|nr:MAG: UbiA prenyltransferase family protein [Thermoplasmata archaeon]